MRVKVRVSFDVEVEVSDDVENVFFLIEDNGCPGTGAVGAQIERLIQEADESDRCWACAGRGESKVVAINGVPIENQP